MSVVIAIKDSNQVIMACDTQITSGGVRRRGIGKSNYKIWHPNSKAFLLMGTAGSLREKNVIQTYNDLIKNHEYIEGKIDYQFIVQKVVKRLFNEMKVSGLLDEKAKPYQMSNRYLLAFKNQLFEIDRDGAVIEVSDYTAIGSASNEALASLHATINEESEVRILKAMQLAKMNDIYVSEPIIIGSTTCNEFKIIENDKERFDE